MAELLDRMLLTLWGALFLAKSEEWTKRGVSNMPSDEPYEVAKWFMRFSAVFRGVDPLRDGEVWQGGWLSGAR